MCPLFRGSTVYIHTDYSYVPMESSATGQDEANPYEVPCDIPNDKLDVKDNVAYGTGDGMNVTDNAAYSTSEGMNVTDNVA